MINFLKYNWNNSSKTSHLTISEEEIIKKVIFGNYTNNDEDIEYLLKKMEEKEYTKENFLSIWNFQNIFDILRQGEWFYNK